jgi:hypothetical protein
MRKRYDESRNKKILGLILVITMFGSVFAFIFFGFSGGGSASGVFEYNGFELVDRGTHWSTMIDGREALFSYLPDDLGFVFITDDIANKIRNKAQIDITSEFEDVLAEPIALAQFQMQTTFNNFNIFLRNGFTSQYQSFPIVTCAHATEFVPVIYFTSGNATKLSMVGSCVIAEAATAADVIRIKDALSYKILGII